VFGLAPTGVVHAAKPAIDGVKRAATPAEAGPAPKLVILGVKPQMIDEVAGQLKTWLTSKTVVVSLLVGIEAASLRQRLPKAGPTVRALPNLPVARRRGVVALFSDEADEAVRQQLANLFAPLGFAPWMADEAKLAAVGSVAGAGPAYVARFIDAPHKIRKDSSRER